MSGNATAFERDTPVPINLVAAAQQSLACPISGEFLPQPKVVAFAQHDAIIAGFALRKSGNFIVLFEGLKLDARARHLLRTGELLCVAKSLRLRPRVVILP